MINNYKKDIDNLIKGINISYKDKVIKHHGSWKLIATVPRLSEGEHNLLIQQVYSQCYCRLKFDADLHIDYVPKQIVKKNPNAEFINNLKKANNFKMHYSSGWRVLNKFSNGAVTIHNMKEMKLVAAGQYVMDHYPSGIVPQNGQLVSIRNYSDHLPVDGFFQFIFGEYYDSNGSGNLIRFYFNIVPDGAALLVKRVSDSLNKFRIPFQLKCLAHPDFYDRADAAVLYVEKRYFHIVRELIAEFYPTISNFFKNEIPLFTCAIANGLSFAEQPTDNKSFGMNRSALMVEAIVNCITGVTDTPKWSESFDDAFRKRGLSPNEPFLNKNSSFNFY